MSDIQVTEPPAEHTLVEKIVLEKDEELGDKVGLNHNKSENVDAVTTYTDLREARHEKSEVHENVHQHDIPEPLTDSPTASQTIAQDEEVDKSKDIVDLNAEQQGAGDLSSAFSKLCETTEEKSGGDKLAEQLLLYQNTLNNSEIDAVQGLMSIREIGMKRKHDSEDTSDAWKEVGNVQDEERKKLVLFE